MKVVLEKNGFFKDSSHPLDNRDDLRALEEFFKFQFAALAIISKYEVEFKSIDKAEHYDPDTLYLSYHNVSHRPNVWTLKRAYLPDYYYLDRCGYSGWAEICKSPLVLPYSDIEVEIFYDTVIKSYLNKRVSKFPQSDEPFVTAPPYVFVPLQMANDEVAKLGYLNSRELALNVIEVFRGTKYKVVIKPHPCDNTNDWGLKEAIWTNASIHDIIPNSSAIYTVNSGVGFESLLYLKKVYTAGISDYQKISQQILKYSDIEASVKNVDTLFDKKRIRKYLYRMLKFEFLNVNDPENIRHHLNRIITHFNPLT